MDIVTGEIQRDQDLENDGIPRPGGREEDQKAGCGASISHHIQDSAEFCRLLEMACCVPIEGIE